jgi:hypothetical protein
VVADLNLAEILLATTLRLQILGPPQAASELPKELPHYDDLMPRGALSRCSSSSRTRLQASDGMAADAASPRAKTA